MGRTEEFYHTLEITAPIIFDCEADYLSDATTQWRWFVLGLWNGMKGWMFVPPDALEVQMPTDWR